VAGVGATGCALLVFALATRWKSSFPAGLAAVGAAYAVFLAVRNGAVDAGAPAVAAALFAAAELGFWSLERTPRAATALCCCAASAAWPRVPC
jgi:hypothetical protein